MCIARSSMRRLRQRTKVESSRHSTPEGTFRESISHAFAAGDPVRRHRARRARSSPRRPRARAAISPAPTCSTSMARAIPQISPDGRTIAYVRQSNDIMTDKARPTIWLVDVATGQQRPLVAGAGSYFSPRWSPDGTPPRLCRGRGRQPRSSTCAGWGAARARGSPAFPTARSSIAWSPDGRRIAYSMLVPDDGAQARQGAAPSPKAPNGPTRSR